ncbi:MAG TPA: nicotinate-nucleotide adenylyltransferase [Bacteroidota bacterium]|nr:nicotinate-nucleotide adenylyltransferase [Bacteroidota bacterium]
MMARSPASHRIGIFGGSFDPVHNGHLRIATKAMNQLHLDRIFFLPAYFPPHKRKGPLATASNRLAMLRLAIRDEPRWKVLTLEVRRRGVSYTFQSVRTIRTRYPKAKLFLIVGSDNAAQFESWRNFREILRHTVLAVYPRRGFRFQRKLGALKSHTQVIKSDAINDSSTEIRRRVRSSRSIASLVPPKVGRYIESHGLYRKGA